MKEIKLTGRERAVVKAIDFSLGCTGTEIMDRTKMEAEEVLDMLNGLAEVGYVEAFPLEGHLPYSGAVPLEDFEKARFEVNPSYVAQLKEAIRR